MSIIHPDDFDIIKKLNVNKYHAIIAGRAVRLWYSDQPIGSHDIDLWFTSTVDYINMRNRLLEIGALEFESDNACSFTVDDYRIQVIKGIYNSVEDIFSKFDITVCKAAIVNDSLVLGESFKEDIKNKKLRFDLVGEKSIARMFKYMSYGFFPDSTTVKQVFSYSKLITDFNIADNGCDYHGF
jgi:hypothetical protein